MAITGAGRKKWCCQRYRLLYCYLNKQVELWLEWKFMRRTSIDITYFSFQIDPHTEHASIPHPRILTVYRVFFSMPRVNEKKTFSICIWGDAFEVAQNLCTICEYHHPSVEKLRIVVLQRWYQLAIRFFSRNVSVTIYLRMNDDLLLLHRFLHGFLGGLGRLFHRFFHRFCHDCKGSCVSFEGEQANLPDNALLFNSRSYN